MKFIVNTCSGREHFVDRIKDSMPNVIVNFDDFKDPGLFRNTAYLNYRRAWFVSGDEGSVHMDDDIILCSDFEKKCLEAIAQYPNKVIQFFSMRQKDLTIGTRLEAGSTFMMQQCYYLPPGYGLGIAEESIRLCMEPKIIKEKYWGPTDFCVSEFLRKRKEAYVIWIPNLVDHEVAKSRIDPRRSSKRQSKTFKF